MRHIKLTIAWLAIISIGAGSAWANSKLLNIQGKLTDTSGNPLTGTQTVTFRLYTSSSASIGSAVWTESQSVSLSSGLFNVSLGTTTSMDSLAFSQQYYLGIQVAGDANELSPRQALGASAYAQGSLGTFNVGANLAVSSGNQVIVGSNANSGTGPGLVVDELTSGNLVYLRNANGSQLRLLNATAPDVGIYLATLDGTATNNSLNINNGGTHLFTVQNDGKVGIGVAGIPASSLHISSGSIKIDGSGAKTLSQVSSNSSSQLDLDATAGQIASISFFASGSRQWLIGEGFAGDLDKHLHVYPYGSGNIMIGATTRSPETQLEVEGTFSAGSGAAKSTFTTTGQLQLSAAGIRWSDGTTNTAGVNFVSTYVYIGSNFSVEASDMGVCFGTATWTSIGGRAVVSFTGVANSATSLDKPRASFLIDGAFQTPYTSVKGVSMNGNTADDNMAFSVPLHAPLTAGTRKICLTAWRSGGSSATFKCGEELACVLHILEWK